MLQVDRVIYERAPSTYLLDIFDVNQVEEQKNTLHCRNFKNVKCFQVYIDTVPLPFPFSLVRTFFSIDLDPRLHQLYEYYIVA